MRRALLHRVVRLISSIGFIALFPAISLRLRNVNDTTVALLMVLCVVGIAIGFGGGEALAAAVAAGVGFHYFLLPPHGFGVGSGQHWVALAAFSLTAVVTSQLAAQAERRRIVAERQQQDVEKLYQLGNTLLRPDGSEPTLAELADKMVAIFGADGVALYAIHSDEIVRAGPGASAISDNDLYVAAALDRQFGLSSSSFSVIPVRH
jgi:two-component system sensor histidine kinase KdpD